MRGARGSWLWVIAIFAWGASNVLAQQAPRDRPKMRAALGGLFAPSRPSPNAEQGLVACTAQLARLERHGDARAALAALDQARRALVRARRALAARDPARAARAKAVAWAALALGARQIALAQAERARAVAELRANAAEAAAARARERLAQAERAASAVRP